MISEPRHGRRRRTPGRRIEANGWGKCGRVTRHQLLIHPDVPYTSHNSSMCFLAEVEADSLEQVTDYCCATLAVEAVEASDPGLCVAALDKLSGAEALITYGREAKKRVFTKDEAYATALRCGAHLSEHGGTGQGVIGALAGSPCASAATTDASRDASTYRAPTE